MVHSSFTAAIQAVGSFNSSSGHCPADFSVSCFGCSPGFRGGGPGPAHSQQVQQSGGAHPGERRLEVVRLAVAACLCRPALPVQSDLAFSFSSPHPVTCQPPPLLLSPPFFDLSSLLHQHPAAVPRAAFLTFSSLHTLSSLLFICSVINRSFLHLAAKKIVFSSPDWT